MLDKKTTRHQPLNDFGKFGLDIDSIEVLATGGVVPGLSLTLMIPGREVSVSFGHYSDSDSEAVSADTLYDLASITKLFTTALVLRLHQAGKLSIYDPGSKYLSNFRDSQVRLIDLLTHKVDFAVALGHYRDAYPSSFEQEIMKIIPPKTPASTVHYANLGFIYLGKIIEQIEHTKLNDVIANFANELGLQQTTTGADLTNQTVLTPPTELIDGTIVQNMTHDESARLLGGIAGNAGVFASARDLALFGKAWLDGKMIDRDILDEIVFQNYNSGNDKPQALGWWLRVHLEDQVLKPKNVYSHTGYTGSYIAINPTNQKVCALTCNRTYYGRDNVRHREIWKILTDWMVE